CPPQLPPFPTRRSSDLRNSSARRRVLRIRRASPSARTGRASPGRGTGGERAGGGGRSAGRSAWGGRGPLFCPRPSAPAAPRPPPVGRAPVLTPLTSPPL